MAKTQSVAVAVAVAVAGPVSLIHLAGHLACNKIGYILKNKSSEIHPKKYLYITYCDRLRNIQNRCTCMTYIIMFRESYM